MDVGKREAVHWLHGPKKKPATRRIVDQATGAVRLTKVPRLLSRKWVDPQGNVVMLPVATGRTVTSYNNPYCTQTEGQKAIRGWLRYDECPVRTGALELDGSACSGKFTEDRCCPHVAKVIETRQDANRKATEARELEMRSKTEKDMDRLLDAMKAQANNNTKIIDALAAGKSIAGAGDDGEKEQPSGSSRQGRPARKGE